MAKWPYLLAGIAALSGVAGVMELAAAAHLTSDPLLKTSATFLLVNAAATIGLAALSVGDARRRIWLLIAATTLLGGSIVFSAELSGHVFLGRKILPLAAPVGGALTILGWLAAAAAAFAGAFEP